jgi:hypothetical protein
LLAVAVYASVRGWLEIDHKQRDAAESVISEAHHELYSGGWGFPRNPFNWTLYLFYGGDLQIAELPWLHAQVSRMATLSPVDEDGDMPVGLFVVTDEQATTVTTWEVRGGAVHERSTPELAWTIRP